MKDQIPEYNVGMYRGLSREDASRRAHEICGLAYSGGKTVRAAAHLAELVKIIRIHDRLEVKR